MSTIFAPPGLEAEPSAPPVLTADVCKKGRRVAVLRQREDGCVEFAYPPHVLAAETPPVPVATTLPVTAEPLEFPEGGLPPYFAGLLPEGRRVVGPGCSVKSSPASELGILLALGATVPGDVCLRPAGAPVLNAGRLASRQPFVIPENRRRFGWALNQIRHLEAARRMRCPVVDARAVRCGDGDRMLVIERFDSAPDGTRLAFEDGVQALGLSPQAKYSPSAEELVLQLSRHCAAPQAALRTFYLQIVFAWIIGHGEMHARALGILERPGGGWGPAPITSAECSLLYGDESMALRIGGKAEGLTGRDFRAFAAEIGLPWKAARLADELALRAAATIRLGGLPAPAVSARTAVQELERRRRSLRDP